MTTDELRVNKLVLFFSITGMHTIKQDSAWVDVENKTIHSFDCSKGNIDTKITGIWDQSHPDMEHPRINFGAFNLGKLRVHIFIFVHIYLLIQLMT